MRPTIDLPNIEREDQPHFTGDPHPDPREKQNPPPVKHRRVGQDVARPDDRPPLKPASFPGE